LAIVSIYIKLSFQLTFDYFALINLLSRKNSFRIDDLIITQFINHAFLLVLHNDCRQDLAKNFTSLFQVITQYFSQHILQTNLALAIIATSA
jgi:hypothetical protein